jgi:HAD superfamily hydrolase (TIGR01484 family)
MLASDMDGTVIPLEVNPRREREIACFKEAVENTHGLTLAYVTGRDLPLALKGIREHGLPHPEILVCDVGTSVYHSTSSGFGKDGDYVKLMEDARGGVDVRDLRHELARIRNLSLQPEERQTESKLSYHLPPGVDHEEVLMAVQEVLDGLEGGFQAVYSVGAPHGRGLLDLLPAGVAKDFAIRYLRDHTGITPDRLVYSGDSGNDMAAMLTGFKVVVVGNATPGLRDELVARGGELGILDRLFFAEAYYAAGVMEGCRHFGIL